MDNKNFLDALARRTGLSRKEAARIADTINKAVVDSCIDGDSVVIPAFGCFEVRKKLERIMAVPSSAGKRLLIPPKLVMSFKPSALLKQRLPDNPSAPES